MTTTAVECLAPSRQDAPADGSINVTPPTLAIPEPSTWVMTLAGFAGLGWLASRRGRKPSPA